MRSRNKVLSSEVKTLKTQMVTLVEKGRHDDELIDALMVCGGRAPRAETLRCASYSEVLPLGCSSPECLRERTVALAPLALGPQRGQHSVMG